MFDTLPKIILLTLILVVSGCASSNMPADAPEPAPNAAAPVSFSEDVLPLIKGKFAPLLADEEGLSLASWDALMAGSDQGAVVVPYAPESSLLIRLATDLPADHALRPAADAITDAELALVREWIAAGAPNDAGEIAFADDEGPRLYVANQGEATVSVIDMESHLVIRQIDLQELGFGPMAKPHHIAVEPDGSHWYLSLIGENRVLKFDRQNELVAQGEFEVPGMMALDPSGDLLFVGRSMSAVNPPQRVGVIQRETMEVDEIGVLYPRPHALTLDPAGRYAFSASLAENRMATIDTDSYDVELTSLGGETQTFVQFAVSPTEPLMVAGGQVSGQMIFFDITDPSAPQMTDTLAVPSQPWHPIFSRDGRFVYTGNKKANAVTVVDVDAREIEKVIEHEAISEPHGSAIRPDGRYVYISNNNRTGDYAPRYPFGEAAETGVVTVIDTETNEVVRVIEVGTYPSGVGGPAEN